MAHLSQSPRPRRTGGYARGEETRRRIVEAALETFGALGYDSASTRTLARRAGVNLPALQYYFGGKEGLYLACAHHIADTIEPRLTAIAGGLEAALSSGVHSRPELLGLLRGLVEGLADRLVGAQESENWVLFMVREQAHPTAAFDIVYERIMKRLVQMCASLLALLLDEPAEATATRVRAMAIVSQLLFFVRARRAALRLLGWPDFEGERLAQIKEILWRQTEASLGGPAQTGR